MCSYKVKKIIQNVICVSIYGKICMLWHTWIRNVWSRVERGAQLGGKGLIAFRGRVRTNTTEVITGWVSLTLFLCIYFTCICIHMHYARCHVLYTIKFNIIILTAQYMVYHNKVVSKNRLILDQLRRFYLNRVSTQFNRLPFTNFVVIQ